ncbi:MAG TPA: class F sortase [Jiangellaceae bacterium]|nr:class F sortase [Jiangellaceae bacterium]
MRTRFLISFVLAQALCLAGCAGANDELIGAGTGPRVTGEPSGPSTTMPAAPSVSPSLAPTAPAGLPSSRPVQVDIPALGVSEQTVDLGLEPDGTMQVPTGPAPVGWFAESPTPGEIGPAVLAGHLTWNGVDGVFRHLQTLKPGDEIVVTRADGSRPRFVVIEVAQYSKNAFPTARVYANTPGPQLRLITCAGDYNPGSHNYSDNVVVYASMQTA